MYTVPIRRRSPLTRAVALLLTGLGLLGAACKSPLPAAPLEHDPELDLPLQDQSLRFAVIGDTGTGGGAQEAVAKAMIAVYESFPFELVLMLGDNLYGSEDPIDYETKFQRPYQPLLDAGVDFYASLGNHDELEQRFYEHFNMDGETYYSFSPDGHDVRFFALYSDYLDPDQLAWIEEELAGSDETWKIVFFHHPLYSSGAAHGPNAQLRDALEPLFVRYGVDVAFTGHEHFYERIAPQKGIPYFIVGSSAKLRFGDVREHEQTAAAFDEGYAFLVIEIVGPNLFFQAIQSNGMTIDKGTIHERTWLAEGESDETDDADAAEENGAEEVAENEDVDEEAAEELATIERQRQRREEAGVPAADADPEQLDRYESQLRERIRERREDASRGDILTADLVAHLRTTVQDVLAQPDADEVLTTLHEANPGPVPVEINAPYPAETTATIPPVLLERFPALPDSIEYRFVGCSLVLLEADSGLILDYVPDCLW